MRVCVALLLALAVIALRSPAQSPATGVIEGRVVNAHSGEFLANARVTLDGTALETFSDAIGQFRLAGVPAGTAKLRVFFTGFEAHAESLVVAAGTTLTRDITLGASASARPAAVGDVVKLDQFVVATTREMDGAAIAINEQRFAANIKNVVSTDEFGNVAEGNPAEFLKFMPGVTIDYTGGNARDISLNGVPSDFVPVNVDGFSVATAVTGGGTTRAVQSDMISINNLARIEVAFSPTPDTQGAALAGSVNMVPRSAFERARPVFNWSTYLLMRDNARDFQKVPGPKPSPTRNVHPGFDFSYVAPVHKHFGFTLSAGVSTNYSPQDNIQMTWRGAGAVTDGNAFPHTTPDKPYLSQILIQEEPKVTTRRAFGATADYRITSRDRVTLAFQFSSFDGRFVLSNVNLNTVRVLPGFTTTSTRGQAGSGTINSSHQERNRYNRTYMPTFVWRHNGPTWKSDLGLGHSQQSDYNRDMEQGFFRVVNLQRTNVTINFDDIFYLRPRVITVTDGPTGAVVNPFALSTYSVVSGTRQANRNYDLMRTAYGNVRRDFPTRVPFGLKAGFDVRQNIRDFRGGTITYNFVGRDGRASTTPVGNDDTAVPFFDPIYSQRVLPYGFPQLESPSNRKLYEHFVANPTQWTTNDNTTYRNFVTGSKISEEIVSALYLRGDVALFDRRLKLVGGLRAEQTNVKAEGPLTDPTRNFRRDASGNILRNPNGTPQLLVPVNTGNLAYSQLTLIDRGAHAQKEYLRWFPSLNASYNVRENLVARAAYYQSVGRPNFIQYSGGITLPDTDTPPANDNRITVNNAAIKAWQSRTFSVRLERYFEGVGQLSVGAFRREFKNFFGNTVFNATPEFLSLYSLDPALYDAYDVATQHNVAGTVRTQGVDGSYKQALTFLPPWARGVQVFANASAQRRLGDVTAAFAGFISRSASWGVSVTRPQWNARVNWNYRGRQRNAPVTGVGIEPGTFNYGSSRLYMDVLGEYNFSRRLSLFVNLRNFKDATTDTEILGPSTPAHAQFRQRIDYAALWTIGAKGTF